MSVPQELYGVISHLNSEGGFSNSLDYQRIAQAATGLPWSAVERAINKCKEGKDFILDHTYFICSELESEPRRGPAAVGRVADPAAGLVARPAEGSTASPAAGLAAGPAAGPAAAGPAPSLASAGVGSGALEGQGAFSEQDELWNRIRWMNTEGGFNDALNYDEIVAKAKGLDTGAIMIVLGHLEEKWQEVNDPNSWVCAALVKRRNSKGGKGKGSDGCGPPHAVLDSAIRERVAWLNTEGGFQDAIDYEEVAEKAARVDSATAMKVLSHLEDKRGEVTNPTSWVCAALIKEGQKSMAPAWSDGWGPAAGSGGGKAGHWQPPDDGGFDKELRRRIAFLNNEGGFGNIINYREVAEAAAGLDWHLVQKVLSHLEAKGPAMIANGNNWICAALCKERGGKGPGGKPRGKGYGKDGGAGRPPPPPPAPLPVQKTITKY